jgi:thiol-disulfide isomerase/thioredoxin
VAKSRPGMLTLALSAAAVLGYWAYRSIETPEPAAPQPAAAVLDLAADPDEPTEARQPVETLPDFSLGNLAGEPQSIRSWPGKPLLINFWATWCAPCLREIPMLKELQSSRPDLQVVGIAIDKREPVVAFAAERQFNYPILIGQSEAWQAAAALGVNIYALPFTIFAAADGSILGVHTGELHAEQLDNFRTVSDDLQAQKIGLAEARSRIAGRM